MPKVDIVSRLPLEIGRRISDFLSPEDVGRAGPVSRIWKNCIHLYAFGLDVRGGAQLDKCSLIPIFRQFSALLIEKNAGYTLLTVSKGISFNKILNLAQEPEKGHPVLFREILPEIQKQFENIETKVVLISNALLRGCDHSNVSIQRNYLEEIECEMLDFVTMLALLFITHISSEEKQLFGYFTGRP